MGQNGWVQEIDVVKMYYNYSVSATIIPGKFQQNNDRKVMKENNTNGLNFDDKRRL